MKLHPRGGVGMARANVNKRDTIITTIIPEPENYQQPTSSKETCNLTGQWSDQFQQQQQQQQQGRLKEQRKTKIKSTTMELEQPNLKNTNTHTNTNPDRFNNSPTVNSTSNIKGSGHTRRTTGGDGGYTSTKSDKESTTHIRRITGDKTSQFKWSKDHLRRLSGNDSKKTSSKGTNATSTITHNNINNINNSNNKIKSNNHNPNNNYNNHHGNDDKEDVVPKLEVFHPPPASYLSARRGSTASWETVPEDSNYDDGIPLNDRKSCKDGAQLRSSMAILEEPVISTPPLPNRNTFMSTSNVQESMNPSISEFSSHHDSYPQPQSPQGREKQEKQQQQNQLNLKNHDNMCDSKMDLHLPIHDMNSNTVLNTVKTLEKNYNDHHKSSQEIVPPRPLKPTFYIADDDEGSAGSISPGHRKSSTLNRANSVSATACSTHPNENKIENVQNEELSKTSVFNTDLISAEPNPSNLNEPHNNQENTPPSNMANASSTSKAIIPVSLVPPPPPLLTTVNTVRPPPPEVRIEYVNDQDKNGANIPSLHPSRPCLQKLALTASSRPMPPFPTTTTTTTTNTLPPKPAAAATSTSKVNSQPAQPAQPALTNPVNTALQPPSSSSNMINQGVLPPQPSNSNRNANSNPDADPNPSPTPPLTRTQQKILLQRLQTLSTPSPSLRSPEQRQRESTILDRVNRDYEHVQIFDPFGESIKRILISHDFSSDSNLHQGIKNHRNSNFIGLSSFSNPISSSSFIPSSSTSASDAKISGSSIPKQGYNNKPNVKSGQMDKDTFKGSKKDTMNGTNKRKSWFGFNWI